MYKVHVCRNAAAGRSMTPENRGSSPTMQEKLARWPRVDSLVKAGHSEDPEKAQEQKNKDRAE